ncbi:MAG: hypothetical protein WA395_14760 [Nitrososphaeraceae archaeon]
MRASGMCSQLMLPLSRCRLVEIILGSIIKQLVNLVHDVIDGNRKGADPRPKVVEAEPYYAI